MNCSTFVLNRRVCIRNNANVIEAVGTFVNGTLNGPGKVTFKDKTIIVGNFTRGIPIGMLRKWTAEKKLKSLSYIDENSFLTKLRQWKVIGNYLVYTEDFSFFRSTLKNGFQTLIVPMKSKEEMVVGNFNPTLGFVKDIYSVDVQIKSRKEECFLDLKWRIKEYKTYDLIFINGTLIKKKHVADVNPCHIDLFKEKTSSIQFQEWEQNFKIPKNFNHIDLMLKLTHILKSMPQANEPLDSSKIKIPFMNVKNIEFNNNLIRVNMSHWNGETLPWIPKKFGFDLKGRLHGPCSLELEPDFYNRTGTNKFAGWSLKAFSGVFKNGKLEDIVEMTTWQGNFILAVFENGELHGPAISYGRSPMYDIWVRITKAFLFSVPSLDLSKKNPLFSRIVGLL